MNPFRYLSEEWNTAIKFTNVTFHLTTKLLCPLRLLKRREKGKEEEKEEEKEEKEEEEKKARDRRRKKRRKAVSTK